jgi:ketosteroid isomerase-like protein
VNSLPAAQVISEQKSPQMLARRQITDKLIADLSAGRVDDCIAACTPDVEMSVPFMTAGLTRRCTGHDELRALLSWAAKTFQPFNVSARRSWELVPNGIVVDYTTDAIHKPSGKPYLNTYLGLFFFNDENLITEWIEYADPIPTLFALSR